MSISYSLQKSYFNSQFSNCSSKTSFKEDNRVRCISGYRIHHEKASHETSLDLDSCFDHQLGLISRNSSYEYFIQLRSPVSVESVKSASRKPPARKYMFCCLNWYLFKMPAACSFYSFELIYNFFFSAWLRCNTHWQELLVLNLTFDRQDLKHGHPWTS